MGTISIQTQQVIPHRQTTNDEMKQQWTLSTEFAKLEEWRGKVGKEMASNRDTHQVTRWEVNHVHDRPQSSMGALWGESQVCFGAIREELSDMRKQNRNRDEPVRGANHSLFWWCKS